MGLTSLSRIIEKCQAKGIIDPTEIARRVEWTQLTSAQQLAAIAYLVRTEYRGNRALSLVPLDGRTSSGQATLSPRDSQGQSGRSRLVPSGHSFLDDEHCIAGTWKLAGDMTASDCLWIAQDYEDRARRNAALADVWRERAEILVASGKKTLRELEQVAA